MVQPALKEEEARDLWWCATLHLCTVVRFVQLGLHTVEVVSAVRRAWNCDAVRGAVGNGIQRLLQQLLDCSVWLEPNVHNIAIECMKPPSYEAS